MSRPMLLLAAAVAGTLALAGCSLRADADAVDSSGEPGLGMCAPGVEDCVDVVVQPDGTADQFDADQARADAASLLDLAEDELPADVRIARRGEEQFMLTEDYRLGRMTVELDADGAGVYRVASVTVELPDGPDRLTR